MAEDALEPLITQCPTCRTRFRVTESQLNIAAGRVRCGACLSVFAGLEHLVLGSGPRLKPGESPNEALDALLDELRKDPGPDPDRSKPASAARQRSESSAVSTERNRASTETLADSELAANPAAVTASDPSADRDADPPKKNGPIGAAADAVEEIDLMPAAKLQESADVPPPMIDAVAARKARRLKLAASNDARAASTPVEAGAAAEERIVEAVRVAAPVELDMRPEDLIQVPRRRRRRWWMPIALLLGVGLLAGQVLYLQFDTWAKNPDIRPVYEWLCPRLHCQLPVMRSLDEIRSKNLVVRANPDVPGELMVDALIVNQARFAQPFPVIELRFSSMDGRPIAARRFKPEEYLAGELKGATMFAPLTPVHIALAIEDPGTDAVSYYIRFR